MTTKYEFINGCWFLVLEDEDAAVVQAEINRLYAVRHKTVDFIGPHKVGNKYVAKGILLQYAKVEP